MTTRPGARGAVVVAALTLLLMATDIVMRQLYAEARGSVDGLSLLPMVLALTLVGGLVAARRPENVYGWILLLVGFAWTVNGIAIDYAALAMARALPGGDAAAVVAVATGGMAWGTFVTFVLLLYPTGRLPSRRWRYLGWVAGLGLLLMTVGLSASAVVVGAEDILRQFASGSGVTESGIPKLLNEMGHIGIFTGMLGGVVSLVVRARRSDAVERLQLKWFALGAMTVAASIMVQFLPHTGFLSWLEIVSLTAMPIVIGIAILRWHLYDIDRIISRTVTYALLTALLVAVYLAAVTTLTGVTAPVTGDSPVAVAAATLLAAAAFGPARRRIQALVDRRFNRARYDASQTVASYRIALREEVDIEALSDELVAAVQTTMQPARTSLWLRESK